MKENSVNALAGGATVAALRAAAPCRPAPTLPEQAARYPELRYMGSKNRLLPWLHQVLEPLDFESALDPFSGSGCVGYLLKAMGRRVVAADFLNFSTVLARATIENNSVHLDGRAIRKLLDGHSATSDFIERTFAGIFFSPEDLRFLDRVWANLPSLDNTRQQALAMAALIRSCMKKQPRGVFTVSGNLSAYDDGRRDLRLSIEEHFLEQIEVFNSLVFSNKRQNAAIRSDVFDLAPREADLVYLDPPYVPRADDNCYVKRYHFLEGLSCYWQGVEIDYSTKVRKIPKKYTPFSYRRSAPAAFERLFAKFQSSIIVLSYSSNGFPDRDVLETLLRRYKREVRVFERPHRYHFGTHGAVNQDRAEVIEYLFVGL